MKCPVCGCMTCRCDRIRALPFQYEMTLSSEDLAAIANPDFDNGEAALEATVADLRAQLAAEKERADRAEARVLQRWVDEEVRPLSSEVATRYLQEAELTQLRAKVERCRKHAEDLRHDAGVLLRNHPSPRHPEHRDALIEVLRLAADGIDAALSDPKGVL